MIRANVVLRNAHAQGKYSQRCKYRLALQAGETTVEKALAAALPALPLAETLLGGQMTPPSAATLVGAPMAAPVAATVAAPVAALAAARHSRPSLHRPATLPEEGKRRLSQILKIRRGAALGRACH